MVTLAHASGLFGGLPMPYPLFLYGMAAVVGVAWVVVRTRPNQILKPWVPRLLPGWAQAVARVGTVVLQVVGVAGWLVVLTAGLFGNPEAQTNVAWLAISVGFLALLPLLSVLLGDVWRAVSPYRTLGASLARVAPADAAPPGWAPWLAPVAVFSLAWMLLAHHDPQSPRALGWWLLIYSVVVLGGALRWGRRWVDEVEGFGVLFSLLASVAVFGRRAAGEGTEGLVLRRPLSGVAEVVPSAAGGAVLLTFLGIIVFDGFSLTQVWFDVIGTAERWADTAFSTGGLVLTVLVCTLVALTAARVAANRTDQDPAAVAVALMPVLVPLAAGLGVAHDLPAVVVDGQFLPILASDPYGQGWDLFGTASDAIDYEVLSLATYAWLQSAAVALGSIAALVVAHDVVLPWGNGRRAALGAVAVAVAIAAVGVIALLLGGE
jgi:hypothetical protein